MSDKAAYIEHIIEIPDYVPPFDLAVRAASLGEEVVRCRDCKHYKPNTYSHFTCELLMFHVQPKDFCAWGERRDA